MVQKQQKEESNKWEPTREDASKLRESLKPFSQRKIHGSLYSAYDQYCASLNIISIREEGIVVHDAAGRTRMNEIDSYRQSLDRFELDKLYQQFPEEREKFMERIRSLRPTNLIKRI